MKNKMIRNIQVKVPFGAFSEVKRTEPLKVKVLYATWRDRNGVIYTDMVSTAIGPPVMMAITNGLGMYEVVKNAIQDDAEKFWASEPQQ